VRSERLRGDCGGVSPHLRRCKRSVGDRDGSALLNAAGRQLAGAGVSRLVLAGGAEGVRAGDSAEVRLCVDLHCPTLVRNCIASDDAEHVLAGRRMLTIRGKKVIGLGILTGFPGVNGVCTCKVLWRVLGCLAWGRGAHLIVGEEVERMSEPLPDPLPEPPRADCTELTINLPPNDANTCWWLSVNFALFHKRRPELDSYFLADDNTSEEPDRKSKDKLNIQLKKNFFIIYKHYTGQEEVRLDTLLELRKAPGMVEAFNVIDIDPVTKERKIVFDVDGSNFQSTGDYISQFFKYIQFPGRCDTLDVKDDGKVYDIFLHELYYGRDTRTEDTVKETGKKYYTQFSQINSTANTVILDFRRRIAVATPIDSTPIEILNQIIIPTIDSKFQTESEKETRRRDTVDKTKLLDFSDLLRFPIKNKEILKTNAIFVTFTLDAIIEATGSHFNTYVKCSGSENWVFYHAIAGGRPTDIITFDEMIKKGVATRAEQLFYSRAGVPTPAALPSEVPTPLPSLSTDLPSPLPSPPETL
jgi:hypothetical protein